MEVNKPNLPISVNQKKSVNDRKFIPKPFVDIAKGMEEQFAKIMLDQMNKTVGESEDPSTGMEYYRGLQDTKRIEAMIEHNGGLGLQNMILDEIYPKRRRSEIAYNHYLKQQESINSKRNAVRMHDMPEQSPLKIHQEGENE